MSDGYKAHPSSLFLVQYLNHDRQLGQDLESWSVAAAYAEMIPPPLLIHTRLLRMSAPPDHHRLGPVMTGKEPGEPVYATN